MFLANVTKNSIKVSGKELLTSGSSNSNHIYFNFSEDWDNLVRIVVFRTSLEKIAVSMVENQKVVPIPWECLSTVGETIFVGVYGMNGANEIILPTIWTEVGRVVDAVTVFNSESPSPTENVLATLVDAVEALGQDINTYSQHPNLKKRDQVEQHPIDAITGLTDSLKEKLSRSEYLTTEEVINLMKGGTTDA